MPEDLPSQSVPMSLPATPAAYEAPMVVATFSKAGLLDDLPEDLAPHIHTIQDS